MPINKSIIKKIIESRHMGKKHFLRLIWGSIWWLPTRVSKHSRKTPKVILFAHSQVMVTHLIAYANAVRLQSNGIRFYVCFFIMDQKLREAQAVRCEWAGIHVVPWWAVPMAGFDLCAVADHSYPQELLNDSIPVLFIYHALTSSDMEDGETYKYGRKWVYDAYGRLKYDCMFEASFRQARTAVQHNHEFEPLIKVVGSSQVEVFLRTCSQRSIIRERLGYSQREIVVMVQSTWGDQSLDQIYGERLFPFCRDISSRRPYRFILSTHPNHWGGAINREDRSAYYLGFECEGVKVLRPEDNRLEYLAACDMCLSDTTSLAFLYAFSGQPLLFVDTPGAESDPDSELAHLMALCPRLTNVADLERQLELLPGQYPYNEVRQLVNSYCDHQGRYAERCAEETMKLLPRRMAKEKI